MRLFIAIDLTDELRRFLLAVRESFYAQLHHGSVRWLDSDQWHLTVRFLGAVPDADVTQVGAALDRACHDIQPFQLRLTSIDSLPNPRQPRIICVDAGGDIPTLQRLHQAVVQETRSWGQIETRPFRPHLTIARIKEPTSIVARAVRQIREQNRDLDAPEWSVQAVHLVESKPGPAGSVYRSVHTAPL